MHGTGEDRQLSAVFQFVNIIQFGGCNRLQSGIEIWERPQPHCSSSKRYVHGQLLHTNMPYLLMTSKLRISGRNLFANDEYREFNSFVYNTVNVLRLLQGDLKILS